MKTGLYNTIKMTATAFAVAFIVYSCGGKIKDAEDIILGETPVQIVDSLFAVQTQNGLLQTRIEAGLMEKYDNDSVTVELFPNGFSVFGYNGEGLLETVIIADVAKHSNEKATDTEVWQVYGNVVIQNVINQQTMETDTLYWDRKEQELFTDCYVKIYSSDGLMQGYGMRSDERGNNARILDVFNSFAVIEKDTTAVVIDSVNFIGPFLKK